MCVCILPCDPFLIYAPADPFIRVICPSCPLSHMRYVPYLATLPLPYASLFPICSLQGDTSDLTLTLITLTLTLV